MESFCRRQIEYCSSWCNSKSVMYRLERLEKAIASAVGREVANNVDAQIKHYKVVIFTRTSCLYCLRAKNTIRKHFGNNFTQDEALFVDIDKDKNGPFVERYLKELTGQSVVPQVFVNRKFIGSMDAITDLHDSGELSKVLEQREEAPNQKEKNHGKEMFNAH